MNKMTIVKLAVAAMLAVPAVPTFAKTTKTHKLLHHPKHKLTLVSLSKKHRVLHHKTTKHTLLSSRIKSSHKSLTSLHKKAKTMAVRPTASNPQVEIGNQPTIDGMHT